MLLSLRSRDLDLQNACARSASRRPCARSASRRPCSRSASRRPCSRTQPHASDREWGPHCNLELPATDYAPAPLGCEPCSMCRLVMPCVRGIMQSMRAHASDCRGLPPWIAWFRLAHPGQLTEPVLPAAQLRHLLHGQLPHFKHRLTSWLSARAAARLLCGCCATAHASCSGGPDFPRSQRASPAQHLPTPAADGSPAASFRGPRSCGNLSRGNLQRPRLNIPAQPAQSPPCNLL